MKFDLQKLKNIYALIIFLQSLLATLGSLFYSTFGDPIYNLTQNGTLIGDGLVPCTLCWFARILMYPILFISFLGILKKDKTFTDYVLALSIPGVGLEIYHYLLQKFPINTGLSCTSSMPCNALQVNYFGFVTIPFLCLVAFIIITIFAFLYSYLVRDSVDRINFIKIVSVYGFVVLVSLIVNLL